MNRKRIHSFGLCAVLRMRFEKECFMEVRTPN